MLVILRLVPVGNISMTHISQGQILIDYFDLHSRTTKDCKLQQKVIILPLQICIRGVVCMSN
jgi:hypothetical protein